MFFPFLLLLLTSMYSDPRLNLIGKQARKHGRSEEFDHVYASVRLSPATREDPGGSKELLPIHHSKKRL